MVEYYFSQKPKSTFRDEHFKTMILGNEIEINSGSGVFSCDRTDFGSRLLIEHALIKKSNPTNTSLAVLDLGCGYGIVGISIKKAYPDCDITLLDINERAIMLAIKNAKKNNTACSIIQSDIFSNPSIKEKYFDIILTNPPFSAGKNLCEKFISESYKHISDGGSLQLVAPHNKGGASLEKKMLDTFGNVQELAKKAGFRVYISIKKC